MKRNLTVRKFKTFEEEAEADEEYYLNLSYEQKLKILIQIIGHKDPSDGAIARHIRIYPLAQSE